MPLTEVDESGLELRTFANMRQFVIWRGEDVTGVSGTGVVTVGVVLPDGKAVTQWVNSPMGIKTITIWDSVDEIEQIHGHNGKSVLIWLD